uniref:MerR n=1 Tax=uncultured Lysobacteraceae bacterium TaxID=211441 RepID=J9V0H8_9GAMM|nr:MerR [uncultured Xanthomonadaceae bacterium]
MQIGQLARQAGVPIDTVRYYERNGVLPAPARHASGYRDYQSQDVARLRFVRRAKVLGFTLGEIRELLALSDHRENDMADMKSAAAAKLADIDRRLAELSRIRAGLQALVVACPGHGALDHCPILHTLAEDDA